MTDAERALALSAPLDCPRQVAELPRGSLCSRCDKNQEAHALRDVLVACQPYLKDSETPAECIERNRADVMSMLGLLAKEKHLSESQAQRITDLEAENARLRATVVTLREHTGIGLDESNYNARWICRVCGQWSDANSGKGPAITHAHDCAWEYPEGQGPKPEGGQP